MKTCRKDPKSEEVKVRYLVILKKCLICNKRFVTWRPVIKVKIDMLQREICELRKKEQGDASLLHRFAR